MPTKYHPIIYAILDPNSLETKYIGQSIRGLIRLKEHQELYRLERTNTYCSRWLKKLITSGQKPIFEILEEYPRDLNAAEQYWISFYTALGSKLTNTTKGGNGIWGFRHSAATKLKLSEYFKGKPGHPHTEAHKLHISKLFKGRQVSRETGEKIARARLKGRYVVTSDGQTFKSLGLAAAHFKTRVQKIWNAIAIGHRHRGVYFNYAK